MTKEAAERRRGERATSDPRVLAEVQRLLGLIRTTLRLLDIPIREVERRTGFSYSYWNQIFSGEIGLRCDLVLALAYVLEIEPAELFHLLYPVRPPRPSPIALLLLDAGEQLGVTKSHEGLVLHTASSQAARWARCGELCGFGSVEEWMTAIADAEVLRQRADGAGA